MRDTLTLPVEGRSPYAHPLKKNRPRGRALGKRAVPICKPESEKLAILRQAPDQGMCSSAHRLSRNEGSVPVPYKKVVPHLHTLLEETGALPPDPCQRGQPLRTPLGSDA